MRFLNSSKIISKLIECLEVIGDYLVILWVLCIVISKDLVAVIFHDFNLLCCNTDLSSKLLIFISLGLVFSLCLSHFSLKVIFLFHESLLFDSKISGFFVKISNSLLLLSKQVILEFLMLTCSRWMSIYILLRDLNLFLKVIDDSLFILFGNLLSFLEHLNLLFVNAFHILVITFSIGHLILQKLDNILNLVNLRIDRFCFSWFFSEFLDESDSIHFILVH